MRTSMSWCVRFGQNPSWLILMEKSHFTSFVIQEAARSTCSARKTGAWIAMS